MNADEARRVLQVQVNAGSEELETAWQARRIELESAYRRLAGKAPPLLPGEAGAPAPEAPVTRSYLRALVLTVVFPGAGSWYAGGRTRGLIACSLSTAVLVGLLLSARSTMAGLYAATTLNQRMATIQQVLADFSTGFQWLMLVALGDAWLATWAHNDRLRPAPPGGTDPAPPA